MTLGDEAVGCGLIDVLGAGGLVDDGPQHPCVFVVALCYDVFKTASYVSTAEHPQGIWSGRVPGPA